MMKTLNKKILTICFAFAMALVMAVPAFADSYRIQSASNSDYWNVTTYNGAVVLNPIKLEGNGCYWEMIFNAGVLKLKCPYTSNMGKTLVASADSSNPGSLVVAASIDLPSQHSSVDIKTIGGGMSRIYYNLIDRYAMASGSEVRVDIYNESNLNHKWYLHA